jgi:hypothetical protein
MNRLSFNFLGAKRLRFDNVTHNCANTEPVTRTEIDQLGTWNSGLIPVRRGTLDSVTDLRPGDLERARSSTILLGLTVEMHARDREN